MRFLRFRRPATALVNFALLGIGRTSTTRADVADPTPSSPPEQDMFAGLPGGTGGGFSMPPGVARVAARVQLVIAVGTIPAAIIGGLVAAPFGWEYAGYTAIGIFVAAIGTSTVGIPIADAVISQMWRSD